MDPVNRSSSSYLRKGGASLSGEGAERQRDRGCLINSSRFGMPPRAPFGLVIFRSLSLSLSFSLILSPSHTHTHTHPLSVALSHSLTHTQTHTHALARPHARSPAGWPKTDTLLFPGCNPLESGFPSGHWKWFCRMARVDFKLRSFSFK